MKKALTIITFILASFYVASLKAQTLDSALQAKVDAKIKEIQAWAADAAIVNTVKQQNASVPADFSAMTQDKWKSLSILDPLVRGFSKNPAGVFLKSKKTDVIAEVFVSDANGMKVAFLNKPSNWIHKGKPKHDVPMTGKTWQGPIEVDESTGLQSVQIAVPVLDSDKAIGSMVVGLSISQLSK